MFCHSEHSEESDRLVLLHKHQILRYAQNDRIKFQSLYLNPFCMLETLSIKNFKSIADDTIELGRVNVFIGENGCGKSNIWRLWALQVQE